MAGLRAVVRTSALVGAAVLIGEGLAAVLEPAPDLPEFDASGLVGTGEPRFRWLVLGDSTTTGPGLASADEIWIRQLAARHVEHGAIEVLSLAVGGSTTRDVLADQIPLVQGQFEWAFVAAGGNDVLRGVPAGFYERNLESIVDALRDHADNICLMGVGDVGTIPRLRWPLETVVMKRSRNLDRAAGRVAARQDVSKADHFAYRHAFLDPSIFSADRFHPNAEGHRVWADAIDEVIRPALARPA